MFFVYDGFQVMPFHSPCANEDVMYFAKVNPQFVYFYAELIT